MNAKGPPVIDTSRVTPERIREVKQKIFEQTTKRLFGLGEPANILTECLFMQIPYSEDKGSQPSDNKAPKLMGQPHVMFRGKTGIGKTDLSLSLAGTIRGVYQRIDGTPELMPSDITGSQIMVENTRGERKVQFQPGPIFGHLVLIDEASRIQPKTKSAILRALEERSVKPSSEYIDEKDSVIPVALPLFPISGKPSDFDSPRFFMVLLTQNIFGDDEGTYADPMAQIDRVTLTIPIKRPVKEEEQKIRSRNVIGKTIEQVTDLEEILACAHWIEQNMKISERANNYLTQLLRNTDPDPDVTDPESTLGKYLNEYIEVGASPRTNFHLEAVAKVRAFFDGDMIVKPEHVKAVAESVIVHRLRLTPAKRRNTRKEDVFKRILEFTEIPKWS